MIMGPSPPSPSSSNDASPSISSSWIRAISTVGLQASNPNSDLESCSAYLDTLKSFFDVQLEQQRQLQLQQQLEEGGNGNGSPSITSILDHPPSHPPPSLPAALTSNSNSNSNSYINSNLFGTYYDNNSSIGGHSNTNPLVPSQAPSSSPAPAPMNSRRILIRILTTLSEIHAAKAYRLGKSREWVTGANLYAVSYDHVNNALSLADEQYAQLVELLELLNHYSAMNEVNDNSNDGERMTIRTMKQQIEQKKHNISKDSNVVHISITQFASDIKLYTAMAKKRITQLQNRLRPQWDTRDEVKNRIGLERWRNNPNPKNEHADRRREDEEELGACVSAMETVDGFDGGIDFIERRVTSIRDSVVSGGTGAVTVGSGNNTTNTEYGDGNRSDVRKYRYNGIRPNYNNPSAPRISFEDYPDPTDFGWKFTGSCELSAVEFFEKLVHYDDADKNNNNNNHHQDSLPSLTGIASIGILVKLDFYYSTGTVKTSMDHPTKGSTQLFGRSMNGNSNNNNGGVSNSGDGEVTPELYRQILQNPRVHTNVRYHTKRNRRNNNGKNRNSSGGRRQGGGGRRGRGGRGRSSNRERGQGDRG